MPVADLAAWSIILGLSLMFVGGLVLWAYGARRLRGPVTAVGPETEAVEKFHTRLVRWFFVYGAMIILLGAALLFWGGSVFI